MNKLARSSLKIQLRHAFKKSSLIRLSYTNYIKFSVILNINSAYFEEHVWNYEKMYLKLFAYKIEDKIGQGCVKNTLMFTVNTFLRFLIFE